MDKYNKQMYFQAIVLDGLFFLIGLGTFVRGLIVGEQVGYLWVSAIIGLFGLIMGLTIAIMYYRSLYLEALDKISNLRSEARHEAFLRASR